MANVFLSLPVPAAPGVGAEVDTSGLDAEKTIVATGPFDASLTIEASGDGVVFAPIHTFQGEGKKVLTVAATKMRTRLENIQSKKGVISVEVAAESVTTRSTTLAVPGADSVGAASNVEIFGRTTTFFISGAHNDTVTIEASEDGINFFACVSFSQLTTLSRQKTREVIAKFFRVRRVNPGRATSGSPTVEVAASDDVSSGAATDIMVKVSGNDTTTDFLLPKLSAGVGIALTELNDGGNEQVEISAPGSTTDELVGVTAADTTPDFLDDKVVAGSGITKTVLNPGGDEDLELKVEGANAGNIDTGTPITVKGPTNSDGVSADLARADHQHRLEMETRDGAAAGGLRPEARFVGAGGIAVTAVDNGGAERVDVTIDGSGVTGMGTAVLFWGNRTLGAAADTRFVAPGSDTQEIADTTEFEMPVPRAGTAKSLFIRHNGAGGNGNDVVYTVRKNGVDTLLTVTLATGAVGQASDLVNTVAFAQGDRISLKASKALTIAGGNVLLMASCELA
jgi:hypothetical protein